jgi:hypothetical protein
MGPEEMMVYLSIVPDHVLVAIAQEEASLYAEAVKSGDPYTISTDTLLSQMIHAHLVWRDLDGDAVDLFNRINAASPNGTILEDQTYSEYASFVRSTKPVNY